MRTSRPARAASVSPREAGRRASSPDSGTSTAKGGLTARVWRGPANSRFDTFELPAVANHTVLDVLTYIQRRLDPTLSYRFACRVGMCGSCAMTVDGRPRWTCRTHVLKAAKNGVVTIEPLRNMPVIKDLVVDMRGFFEKWSRAMGYFVPPGERPSGDGFAIVPPTDERRAAADAALECIGCGVCYAACDVVAWNPDYLGPAALNRAWTLVNDVRDDAGPERLRAVAGDAGCHSCHSHESCAVHCPKRLNPTRSIAGLKKQATAAALRGAL